MFFTAECAVLKNGYVRKSEKRGSEEGGYLSGNLRFYSDATQHSRDEILHWDDLGRMPILEPKCFHFLESEPSGPLILFKDCPSLLGNIDVCCRRRLCCFYTSCYTHCTPLLFTSSETASCCFSFSSILQFWRLERFHACERDQSSSWSRGKSAIWGMDCSSDDIAMGERRGTAAADKLLRQHASCMHQGCHGSLFLSILCSFELQPTSRNPEKSTTSSANSFRRDGWIFAGIFLWGIRRETSSWVRK